MIISGVDVGLKYYAHAMLRDGLLVVAGLVQGVEPVRPLPSHVDPRMCRLMPWRLVIECAHARPADGRTKLREVDALNRAAGRLGALHAAPEFVIASQWKGEVPKKLDHQRTLALLSSEERAILPTKKAELVHVMDAIGIALWAAGRKTLSTANDNGSSYGPGPCASRAGA